MRHESSGNVTKPAVPAHGAYVGAILEEGQTRIEDFNEAAGFRHPLFMTFVSFPNVLQPEDPNSGKLLRFVEECRANHAIPAITLETFGGLDSYSRGQAAEFADLLRNFNLPMILRWNHEMNGSWYPWGQQPERYVARFREFADAVHDRAPGVAMAWTPNQGWGYPWRGCAYHHPNLPSADPYAPYDPGVGYADWVGISFYHWGEPRGANQVPESGKWGRANGIGNPVPNFHKVYALETGRPMMIAETSALFDTHDSLRGGAREADIKRAWIQQVYNLTDVCQPRLDSDLPRVKAIFWFNIRKREAEVNSTVDWRIDGDEQTRRFYSQTIANSYFTKDRLLGKRAAAE